MKPHLLPHIINRTVMRNFCLTVSFSHRRKEALGMKGSIRSGLCNQQGFACSSLTSLLEPEVFLTHLL